MINNNIYKNKKVFLKTSYGRFFTIDVKEVTDISLNGIDKYGEPIDIAFKDISSISIDTIEKKRW